jgi:outer membrane protein assembly factor BamB
MDLRSLTLAAVVSGLAVARLSWSETKAGAVSWPHWLGPTHDGRAEDPGVFAGKASLRLQKAWSHSLETGQAGLAVADGRVYTSFTDGTDDYAIALLAQDGKEAWRAKLDPSVRRRSSPAPRARRRTTVANSSP